MASRPRQSKTRGRNYGYQHKRTRNDWVADVEAGLVDCREVVCIMPTRRIKPGQAWDLAHDRSTGQYRGPAHMECNRSEAALYLNRMKRTQPASRDW